MWPKKAIKPTNNKYIVIYYTVNSPILPVEQEGTQRMPGIVSCKLKFKFTTPFPCSHKLYFQLEFLGKQQNGTLNSKNLIKYA